MLTVVEQRAMLKVLIGDNNLSDDICDTYLSIALDIAKRNLFPYDLNYEDIELPERYDFWQVQCAKELYDKNGFEGVSSYSENGLSISYSANMIGSVSVGLMSQLLPKARVPQ